MFQPIPLVLIFPTSMPDQKPLFNDDRATFLKFTSDCKRTDMSDFEHYPQVFLSLNYNI